MTLGISFLSKAIWMLFYGNSTYGPSVLSYYIFVALFIGLFTAMITSLQVLKNYKAVFVSLIVGFLIKVFLNNNMILAFYNMQFPPYYGVITASILGYFVSFIICIIVLKSKYDIHFEEVIVISVNKNYNIDYLLSKIQEHQNSYNVYVVGHTNAGKSSLINKLIKNYSENDTRELTMSPLPSTTLNTVSIEINKYLTLIDTPGLVDTGSILNFVDEKMVKKISPKKEIKPRTYQLRKNQSIIIEDLVRIDYVEGERNSFTLFISNDLKVKRLLNLFNNEELKDKNKETYNLKYDEDIVINGLGFIKVVNKGTVDVYIDKNVDTFTRKSLI